MHAEVGTGPRSGQWTGPLLPDPEVSRSNRMEPRMVGKVINPAGMAAARTCFTQACCCDTHTDTDIKPGPVFISADRDLRQPTQVDYN